MRASVLAIALLVAGCTPTLCGRTSDCLPGLVCTTAGTCAVVADAALVDAKPDAGSAAVRATAAPDDPSAGDAAGQAP